MYEVLQVLSRINREKIIFRYIMVRLIEVKIKDKILKGVRVSREKLRYFK